MRYPFRGRLNHSAGGLPQRAGHLGTSGIPPSTRHLTPRMSVSADDPRTYFNLAILSTPQIQGAIPESGFTAGR